MPAPIAYTEPELAAFMHNELRLMAPLLDLSLEGAGGLSSYAEAVNDTVLAYHNNATGTIAEATDMLRLRALARVKAWTLAAGHAASLYDSASEDQKESLGQVYKNTLKQLDIAQAAVDGLPVATSSSTVSPGQSTAVRTDVQW